MLLLIGGLAVAQNMNKADRQDESRAVQAKTHEDERDSLVYGMALGDMLYESDYNKRAEVLHKLSKAGFEEVRISLSWDKVETRQGAYTWSKLDSLIKAVEKQGLSMILLSNTTPTWARRDVCKTSAGCPPQNPADYAEFMAAAAERYRQHDVNAWEIWNEQNSNNFWKPRPNPEQYSELLKASYVAIKDADPDATVIIGGLSGDSVDLIGPNLIDPRTYLQKLYGLGMRDYFDGLGYHPYLTDVGLPTKKGDYNGWAKMNASNNSLREIMTAHGDADKDIWITEFGIPTGGSGPEVTNPDTIPAKADHASYEAQAEIASRFVSSLNESPWIRNFDWYTYQDDTTAQHFSGAAYGLWKQDGTPKPVLKVLQDGMQHAKSQGDSR